MQGVSPSSLRRVVITGLGVVAPNGIGKENFWQACITGRSGIRRITRFDASQLPSQIAGEVVNFVPEQLGLTHEEVLQLDRGTLLALAAANLAWQDGGLAALLDEVERNSTGVYIGTTMDYVVEGERAWLQLTQGGTRSPDDKSRRDRFITSLEQDVSWSPGRDTSVPTGHDIPLSWPGKDMNDEIRTTALITNASAVSIAAHYQLHGPCMVISTACSAGADAIGQAYWAIQEGRAERMLAGGTDSAISPIGLDVFCVVGALSNAYNDAPERASRPYDRDRDGFVMAEGAGIVLLEERELALARGAHIYAEVVQFSSNSNAYHMTSLPADGAPLQRLLEQALAEANLHPEQVDYINSHGSSTLPNEIAETAAYKTVFGKHAYALPISATKSLIGHTQGAASAIETVVTALVLERQEIPPTINQEHADPQCDLDYVPNIARKATVDIALTHSSGFGGVNSVLILAKPDSASQFCRKEAGCKDPASFLQNCDAHPQNLTG